jgi:2-(1,2-epoxy-1,2-dihydrophenyl)acetyl-CoA isomerase
MSSAQETEVLDEGSVRWIVLNRPERLNAMTFTMWDELVAAFEAASEDSRVRCIVLTGAGRGFCSGRDMDEAASYLDAQPLTSRRLEEMHRALIPPIVEAPKPVIAAVNGAAVGVGLSLALACDLRVASEAARFGVGFLNVGLTPDAGATYLLPATVGYSVALELAATGEVIDAARAMAIGMVNRVVPSDALRAEVRALASRLAEVPAAAFAATKELLREGPRSGLETALVLEAKAQPDLLATPEYRDRIQAFIARRAPGSRRQ